MFAINSSCHIESKCLTEGLTVTGNVIMCCTISVTCFMYWATDRIFRPQ